MAFDEFSTLEQDLFFIEALLAVMLQLHILPAILGLARGSLLQLLLLIVLSLLIAALFTQVSYLLATAVLYQGRRMIDSLPEYDDTLNLGNIVFPSTAIITPVFVSTAHRKIFLSSSIPILMADALMTLGVFLGVEFVADKTNKSVFA